MASNCKAIRAEIEEGVGGAARPSRGVAAHLAGCAGCLDFLSERESLRRLVGGLERVEAPGDFEFRLRARMAAAKETKRTRFHVPRLAPGLASVALAAVFVASVAALYYFNRTAPTVAERETSHQPSSQTQTAAQQSSPANAGTTKTQSVIEVADGENKRKQAAPSVNDGRDAVVRPSKQERRRVSAAARATTTEPRTEVGRARDAGVLEFGLSTSQVIKGPNVKLEVPGESPRVFLRDERGTSRRLAMRPVSFGAQTPVGKRAELKKTTLADDEGVW